MLRRRILAGGQTKSFRTSLGSPAGTPQVPALAKVHSRPRPLRESPIMLSREMEKAEFLYTVLGANFKLAR